MLKKVNIGIIIDFIKKFKNGTSIIQISKSTGISKPTVGKVVEELIQKKILLNLGKGSSKNGRKPNIISFNKDYGFIISLDLGPDQHKIAICNLNGEIINKKSFSTLEIKEEHRLKRIIDEIIFIKKAYNIKNNTLCIVAFGIPGIVNPEDGTVSSCPIFPNWKNYPLGKELIKALNVTEVFLENDVNLCAYGEFYYCYNKEISNLFFITWSRGIGGGVIINKSIYRGAKGAAGELDYSIIRNYGLKYKDANINDPGYRVSVVSTAYMLDEARILADNNKNSRLYSSVGGKLENISLDLIFKLARENEPLSKSIIDKAFEALTVGVADSIAFLAPDVLIIGGEVSDIIKDDEFYIKKISEYVNNFIIFYPNIQFSRLGSLAGVMGGIAYSLEFLNDFII
ncbi:MAG: ROK family protein [Candidatus Humimicrobiaceae bacterium]